MSILTERGMKQVVGPPTADDLEVVPNPEVREYIRKMIKPGATQVCFLVCLFLLLS